MDRRFPILILLAAAAAAAVFFGCGRSRAPTELHLRRGFVPTSSNPLDLEAASNAMALIPVRAPLVSTGKRGEIRGVLASRWKASADFREWRFEFRDDLAFETGEIIRPAHFAAAWTQFAAELRRRGSDDALLSKLEGFASPEPDGSISGLSFDEHSLTLRFRTGFPRLLAHAGDVAYALTHASCREPDTGAWICARKAVSSGPYRIVRWDKDGLELRLRRDFPARDRHPRAPDVIRFDDARSGTNSVEVRFQDSKSPLDDPAFRFLGGMESAIGYAYCNSWTHPKSPCRDAGSRRTMRARFYAELRKAGREFPNSFFPLSIPGIREGTADPRPSDAAPRGTFRVPKSAATADRPDPVHDALAKTAVELGFRLEPRGVEYGDFFRELTPGLGEYRLDLMYFTGALDPEDPVESVRSMFLSRESTRLPDPTGRIRAYLEREPVDLSAVNDVIWEDALVWPLGHVRNGLWTKGGADLSQINGNDAVPALQWVGIE
ncbi:MAG: hypothetical protein AUJ52_15425 [Elusimicrobia bacterium CG1_02_63_36]|nr:MAG: hypothetical protein AUJ52_15425 [Elusimicrobia bacterium CG1_02_63_36]PIP84440.1 MAG: hypothetical protein COR54_04555 [Elusimicrobia bacterium CG22_combo_CG10-13_8_21_14_all_63_91]PJA18296.1 MAG: hypothetical protein COX66_01695 [Elusimicrobia bacterium CG_4_10_14_0_2_um_filter_63_34]PJB23437.1 MAG: hypothetical protein CO113_18535 [Elusimicrobia bacterium CG_4_9_14_3_um_filter_62_55]